jgi:hypothetical protein
MLAKHIAESNSGIITTIPLEFPLGIDRIKTMNLTCPKCSRTITGENISVKDGFAQCDECHSVYTLQELAGMGGTTAGSGYHQKPEVALPKGMEKNLDFDGLTITRRWRDVAAFVLIPMTIFWNGFLVFWISTAIVSGEYMMLAFTSIHIAVGIFLLYSTIARLINTTTVKVGPGTLTIKHRPIPWRTPKPLEHHEVRQFYGRKRVTRSSNGGSSVRYELRVLLSDGSDRKLLGGFTNREQVLYLEQEIERYWSINDERVDGQMD